MTGKDLIKLGFKPGPAMGVALRLIPKAQEELSKPEVRRELKAVLENPVQHSTHRFFGELAVALREEAEKPAFQERPEPAP